MEVSKVGFWSCRLKRSWSGRLSPIGPFRWLSRLAAKKSGSRSNIGLSQCNSVWLLKKKKINLWSQTPTPISIRRDLGEFSRFWLSAFNSKQYLRLWICFLSPANFLPGTPENPQKTTFLLGSKIKTPAKPANKICPSRLSSTFSKTSSSKSKKKTAVFKRPYIISRNSLTRKEGNWDWT